MKHNKVESLSSNGQGKLRKMYIVILVGNILAVLGLLCVIKYGYYIEYPRIFFGSLNTKTYSVLLFVLISPIIFSIIGLFTVGSANYWKHYKTKNIASLIALVFCVLLSIASSLLLFTIPPIESFTDSDKEYLKVDSEIQRYEDVYKEFFPAEIPEGATNTNYLYRKYSGLFETSVIMSASWSLPEGSYEDYKQSIEQKFSMTLLRDNKFEINLDDSRYPFNLRLIFEYNDDTNRLHYIATNEKQI